MVIAVREIKVTMQRLCCFHTCNCHRNWGFNCGLLRRRKRKTRLDFMNLFSSKDIGKTVTTELAVLPAVGSKTYPMAYSPEDEV